MECKAWTYDEFPAFDEDVDGATHIATTGGEVGVRYHRDVPYAELDGMTLCLQILEPVARAWNDAPHAPWPCVVYVQGSAWREQNVYRDLPQVAELARRGYVVAVVEYRHSGIAPFPAQIHDAQNAIRYLRSHAGDWNIDPARIAVAGNSSGGHTAVFCGLMSAWEARGAVAPAPAAPASTPAPAPADPGATDAPASLDPEAESCYPGVSAQVRGIIDLYGAVSLMRADGFPTTIDHHLPSSPEGMLMGCNLRERPDLCRLASAGEHLVPGLALPSLLIVHGTKDRTVSTRLSVDLYERARACGLDAELYLLDGADHGGPEFFMPALVDVYDAFLKRCLA